MEFRHHDMFYTRQQSRDKVRVHGYHLLILFAAYSLFVRLVVLLAIVTNCSQWHVAASLRVES